MISSNINKMSIHLPTNLHEKMEYTISQYIGELHEAGIIEKGKEYYELNKKNVLVNDFYKDLPKVKVDKIQKQGAISGCTAAII